MREGFPASEPVRAPAHLLFSCLPCRVVPSAHQPPPGAPREHDEDVTRVGKSLLSKAQSAGHLSSHPLPAKPLDLIKQCLSLQWDLNDLLAVAVRQAHEYGASWDEIGDALGTVAPNARSRYSKDKVAAVLRNRALRGSGRPTSPAAPEPRTPGPASTTVGPATDKGSDASLPGHPGYQLTRALSHLQRTSERSVRSLARDIGISPSLLSRILLGKRHPKWTTVERLATLCGADPADLLPLWDKARGVRPAPPSSPAAYPEAAHALKATLRGMWLAAAKPDVPTLCAGARVLTPRGVEALLDDKTTLQAVDWPVIASLTTILRGSPDDVRPLWEQIKATHVSSENRTPPTTSFLPAASFG